MIDHKCLKVLRAKEWAGLTHVSRVDPTGVVADLNTPKAQVLRRKLYGGAITVLRDQKQLLPLRDLDQLNIASVVIGEKVGNDFQQALGRYAPMQRYSIGKEPTTAQMEQLMNELERADLVIASVHNTSYRASKEFGIPDRTYDLMRRLAEKKRVVYVHFASPYRLTTAYGVQRCAAVVVGYEDDADANDMAAQAIFGAVGANGKLPVTASSFFEMGDGGTYPGDSRFSYGLPEDKGVRTADLKGIDAIVREGIAAKAFPGCQVLVAVDGAVIWNKAYGHSTYERSHTVSTEDVYDLASITKVAATTLSLMKLVDEGKVSLDNDVGTFLEELNGTYESYARMKLRDILTHQAGLRNFVPFYTKLLKDGKLKPGVSADTASEAYPVRVAEGMYIPAAYRDSLMYWVVNTPLGKQGDYVYSDMGYYLFQEIIERITGQAPGPFT